MPRPKKNMTNENVNEKEQNITREEYDKLLKEIQQLKRGEMPVYDPQEEETYYTVRMYNGFPIIGFENVLMNELKNKEEIIFYYLENWETKQQGKMEFLKYINDLKKEKVKSISSKIKEKVEIQGYTTIKNVPEGSYKTVDTGIKVPLKVITPQVIHTVQFENGKKLEINNDFLN